MTTFAYRASFGMNKAKKPKIRRADFGDGYVQRSAIGINNNPAIWAVKFTNLTDADAKAIMDFLDTANGVSSFTWVDPDGVSGTFICEDYQRDWNDEDKNLVQATFEQVFGE